MPEAVMVHHECHNNRQCINLEYLQFGTQAENHCDDEGRWANGIDCDYSDIAHSNRNYRHPAYSQRWGHWWGRNVTGLRQRGLANFVGGGWLGW